MKIKLLGEHTFVKKAEVVSVPQVPGSLALIVQTHDVDIRVDGADYVPMPNGGTKLIFRANYADSTGDALKDVSALFQIVLEPETQTEAFWISEIIVFASRMLVPDGETIFPMVPADVFTGELPVVSELEIFSTSPEAVS